jgi:hypothetical protein
MLEVVRFFLRSGKGSQGLCGSRAAAGSAALVQEQNAVVFESSLEPAASLGRTRRSEAWTSLQKDQPGKIFIFLTRSADFASEDFDLRAGGIGMVQRDLEEVVGQDQTWNTVGVSFQRFSPKKPKRIKTWIKIASRQGLFYSEQGASGE